MKAIIVDDEKDAVETLKIILKEYCQEVEIIDTAETAIEAIKSILKNKPDLVFLDVEMPHGNGFDVLEGLEKRDFKVIFTTAYNHYAIKAIKFSALDYLLKPIDIDELVEAVKNARISIDNDQVNSLLLRNLEKNRFSRIPIFHNGAYQFMEISDMIYLESDGAYTNIRFKDQDMISSKHLKRYEDMLGDYGFYRVSKRHLVNVKHVKQFLNEDNGVLEMSDKSRISISRSKKSAVRGILGI